MLKICLHNIYIILFSNTLDCQENHDKRDSQIEKAFCGNQRKRQRGFKTPSRVKEKAQGLAYFKLQRRVAAQNAGEFE